MGETFLSSFARCCHADDPEDVEDCCCYSLIHCLEHCRSNLGDNTLNRVQRKAIITGGRPEVVINYITTLITAFLQTGQLVSGANLGPKVLVIFLFYVSWVSEVAVAFSNSLKLHLTRLSLGKKFENQTSAFLYSLYPYMVGLVPSIVLGSVGLFEHTDSSFANAALVFFGTFWATAWTTTAGNVAEEEIKLLSQEGTKDEGEKEKNAVALSIGDSEKKEEKKTDPNRKGKA
eukprot:jgi/Bigna1/136678/aug1.35_g11386